MIGPAMEVQRRRTPRRRRAPDSQIEEVLMFGLRRGRAGTGDVIAKPPLTARWLREVLFTNRLAFEREMQRDRRRLERRFNAYMQDSTRQDEDA